MEDPTLPWDFSPKAGENRPWCTRISLKNWTPTGHPSNSRCLHSGFVVYEVSIRTAVRINWPDTTLRRCTSKLGRPTYKEVLHDNKRSTLRSRETLLLCFGTLSCKGDHIAPLPTQMREAIWLLVIQSVRDTVRKADSIPKPNISVSDSIRFSDCIPNGLNH